jgi:two-component system OmpR family response regulator
MTLDRMLPDADGVMIVRSLRESGCTIPVLILSSLSDVDDRVRGLRAGGDDYLTKPYHADELLVRVQALIRRSAVNTGSTGTSLKVGDLELDLLQRVASRSGRTIALVPAEFKLLSYMMEHKGRALTREMIFEAVWGYRFDPGTNTIDVHIARLRKKLELPGETRLLHTVRNEGYVIDQ